MTTRRDFLRRSSIALAGGLILGDAALELFERLTHVRKSFPSAAIAQKWGARVYYPDTYGKIVSIKNSTMTIRTEIGYSYSSKPTDIMVFTNSNGDFREGEPVVIYHQPTHWSKA